MFTVFDWVSAVILAVFVLRGVFKGFVAEFSGKAGILFGLLVGLLFYQPVVMLLQPLRERFNLGGWTNILVFVVLAIAGYMLVRVFLSVMRDLFEALKLNVLDYIFGAVLGGIEGIAVVSVVVYLVTVQTIIPREVLLAGSYVSELTAPVVLAIMKFDWKPYVRGL